jgi:hypothetical protein
MGRQRTREERGVGRGGKGKEEQPACSEHPQRRMVKKDIKARVKKKDKGLDGRKHWRCSGRFFPQTAFEHNVTHDFSASSSQTYLENSSTTKHRSKATAPLSP